MNSQRPVEALDEAALASSGSRPTHDGHRLARVIRLEPLEAVLGCENYAEVLYHASYKSARYWCDKEAKARGLSGIAVFDHYLHRLSRRGWGRFSVIEADAATGRADICLDYSQFVLAQADLCAAKTCCRFAGWFAGMMDWICESRGRAVRTFCQETQCGADGHRQCIFSVRPRASN